MSKHIDKYTDYIEKYKKKYTKRYIHAQKVLWNTADRVWDNHPEIIKLLTELYHDTVRDMKTIVQDHE